MNAFRTTWFLLISIGLVHHLSPTAQAQPAIAIANVSRSTPVSFSDEILPILRNNCITCHSASEANGELNLENPQAMIKGGDTGPAVVPGKGSESLLIRLAAHQDDPAMPPPENDVAAKPLTPQQLGLIKLWIDQGAKGSATAGVISPTVWRPLPPGPNPTYAVAVTPDGQFAACSRANQIFIYHVPTGQFVTRLTDPDLQQQSKSQLPGIAHLDVVQALAFNRDGDRLASGGFRTAKVWRYPRDVQRLQIAAATSAVNVVAVSPDGAWIATGAADNTLKIWNAATGELSETLAGHTGEITCLQFSGDSTKLFSGSADASILMWDTTDYRQVGRIVTPGPVSSLTTVLPPIPPADGDSAEAASPSDTPAPTTSELLASGGDEVLRLWKLPAALPPTYEDPLTGANVLAVSDDRQWLAVANAQGEVQLRELGTGKVLHRWQAHDQAIHALTFSPTPKPEPTSDGAQASDDEKPTPALRIATASADHSVRIWDAQTGDLQATLRGTLTAPVSLAFRHDGLALVAGAADGSITEWSLATAAPTILTTQTQPAEVSAVSPDGKLLATVDVVGQQAAILLRELATGKQTMALLGHTAKITCLAFDSDSRHLVSGSEDQTAKVWDLNEPKFPEVANFQGHAATIRAVAFNADATQVLSGADDHSLQLWTVANPTEAVELQGHTGPIVGVAIAAQGQPLSVSADKTLRAWNATSGQVARSTALTAAATAMTCSRDGAKVAIATADHQINLYQVSDGKLLTGCPGHTAAIHSLDFSFDNTRLVSAGATDTMVSRVTDGRVLEILTHEKPWTSAVYGPTPEMLLLGDSAGAIQHHTLRFSAAFGTSDQPITSVLYRPDDAVLFTCTSDGAIDAFTIATGAPLFAAKHNAVVHDLALSPDGAALLSAGEDQQIKVWNATNGSALAPPALTGLSGPVQAITFAAEGQKLITSSGGATPELAVFGWPDRVKEQILSNEVAPHTMATIGATSRQVIAVADKGAIAVHSILADRRLSGHTAPINGVTSLGPSKVVTGSEDGTLRVWDVTAATPQIASLNHGAPIQGVAVRPDGQRLASASSNGTVRLWNATNNAQVAEMKGDLRAKATVAKLTQAKTDWTAKVATAKTALDAAQKDLPVKTTAEKMRSDVLATAEKDVTAKAATLATATTAKSQAEAAAIQAAAVAQVATKKLATANQLALDLKAKADLLTEKAAQTRAIAQAEPANTQLNTLAMQASATAEAATAEATKAMAATAQPAKAAETASQAAAAAATKALATAKPFTDASTALSQAQMVMVTAKQLHDSAARDLQLATAAVPLAETQLKQAETTLTQTDTQLAAAVAAEAETVQPIACLQFSPDGRTLATGGAMGVIHTWDGETGKALRSYVGHQGPVHSLTYRTDAEIISGSADQQVTVWTANPNWELERTIGSIADPTTLIDRVVAVDFSNDGKLLATGGGVPSRSGEIKIWNVEDGELVHSLPDAHTDGVNAIAFSPDNLHLASASADKFVKKWDVATGKQLLQFEGHTNHVLGVSWRANGQRLASSGADARIQLWNAITGDRERNIAGYQKQVTAVRFVGQSQFIVSTSGDQIVRMHNTDNGGVQRTFAGATDYMYCIDVTPDMSVVVAGGHDGTLRIWNGTNAQVIHTIEPPEPDKEIASTQ